MAISDARMEERQTEEGRRPGLDTAGRWTGGFNALGVWTLYVKEVQRFTKIIVQTVLAPLVNAVLFLMIFMLALGGTRSAIHGVSFAAFLAPGLIMAAIIQNAFANTSSSLLGSKIQGNYVDFLMPPLGPFELSLCFIAGGATRGLVVAAAVTPIMAVFTGMGVHDLAAVIYFSVAGATLLSTLGLIAGIWAEKFDHMASVQNFVILPLSLLSGTFYSVEDALDGAWETASHFNPFFYLIDGFRYGFLGIHDSTLWVGVWLTAGLTLALWALAYWLLRTGWHLKA
ncbi:MAG: ABC transporter permease [Alphaproteobacteria bacterium]|nr:ABC transporter permease [Alphaproteobacteria bacterium]